MFTDIKDVPHSKAGSHFFITRTSNWSVTVSVCMLATFLVMHALDARPSPRSLQAKDEYYQLNSTETNILIDINITLSQ
jgi:hypothetical protein